MPDYKKILSKNRAPQRSYGRRRKIENLLCQIVVVIALLLIWEYASGRWISDLMVSRPRVIGATMLQWAQDGTYIRNLKVTIEATLAGFAIGAVAGMVSGFVTGTWRRLGEVLDPIFTAFYTLPRLALAPLFLLWFGLGIEFRIMFTASIVFFLVHYNTYYGVRDVSRDLISAVRIMGGSPLQVITRVTIPSALVWVAAGLKISIPLALVGVVVAEMLASDEGMGFLLANAAAQFSTARTFAAIAGLLVVAVLIDWIISSLLKRALRWRYIEQ